MRILSKYVLPLLMFAALLVPARSDAGVRLYVRIGPPVVHTVRVVRPPRPYARAVWVNGHYVYRHGHYVYVKGYWVKPRPHCRYVQPHWKRTRSGYHYVPGHWVRVR